MFTCGVEGCVKTARNYSTLMSHLSRKHSDVDLDELVQSFEDDELVQSFEDDEMHIDETQHLSGGDDEDEVNQLPLSPTVNNLERSAALFLLTLKEKYQLTQSAIDFAVSQVKEMMFYDMEDKRAELEKALGQIDVESSVKVGLSDCLQYRNPFSGLETEYMQAKYYREHFGLVVKETYENVDCTYMYMYSFPLAHYFSYPMQVFLSPH